MAGRGRRMIYLSGLEIWFVTGSQHLYGTEIFKSIDEHSADIARALSDVPSLPVKIVVKPVMTTADSIEKLVLDANASGQCAGLITWMHTFSPARMWIAGLRLLSKPF